MSEEITLHCMEVARVALVIASELNAHGFSLDLQVVEAAALLHDLARQEPNHAAAGAACLASLGEPALAEIVGEHMRLDDNRRGEISEVTVVYLADKFVEGDKIVPLQKRFGAKRDSFQDNPDAIRAVERNLMVSQEVCSNMEKAIGTEIYPLISVGKGDIS